jgi:hypothetical protein
MDKPYRLRREGTGLPPEPQAAPPSAAPGLDEELENLLTGLVGAALRRNADAATGWCDKIQAHVAALRAAEDREPDALVARRRNKAGSFDPPFLLRPGVTEETFLREWPNGQVARVYFDVDGGTVG